MQQIGMRELRHRLRHYLARVDAGEGFEVTVFGRPVAHLGPLSSRRPTLARLIEEGKVTPATNPDTSSLPPPVAVTTGTTATDALLAERRSELEGVVAGKETDWWTFLHTVPFRYGSV